jgi:hypothetical protein
MCIQVYLTLPHSGLRRGFRSIMDRKSVTLSIGTPLCPYPIAYRRDYGLSFRWTVLKYLRSPLCGLWYEQRASGVLSLRGRTCGRVTHLLTESLLLLLYYSRKGP